MNTTHAYAKFHFIDLNLHNENCFYNIAVRRDRSGSPGPHVRRPPRSRLDCLRGSRSRGTGNGGERAHGGKGESPAEEITFDLFGAIEDFNDAVTSGDRTEKVHVTALSVNACQELSGNDVLEKVR